MSASQYISNALEWIALPYANFGGPDAQQERFLRDILRELRAAFADPPFHHCRRGA